MTGSPKRILTPRPATRNAAWLVGLLAGPALLGCAAFGGDLIWLLLALLMIVLVCMQLLSFVIRMTDWPRRALLFGAVVSEVGFCVLAVHLGRWTYRQYVAARIPQYDAIADQLEAETRAAGARQRRFEKPADGLRFAEVTKDSPSDDFMVYLSLEIG